MAQIKGSVTCRTRKIWDKSLIDILKMSRIAKTPSKKFTEKKRGESEKSQKALRSWLKEATC